MANTQKTIKLKNGLKVLLLESHKSPVISVQMWVKTGSADEEKKIAGISHFIEHLVFKGTEKFKVGEIASQVESNGGELNAFTSFDQTVFYVTISTAFKEVALDVISQMMGFPTFDPGEIDNEREVVIEEIKRGNDSPHRCASQQLFKNVFEKHKYGSPVIGFEKVIRTISVKEILKYYYSRYVPENMFLVIAGDFNTPEMKKMVNLHFGKFKKYKLKKIKRIKEPLQKSPRVSVKHAEFKQNIGYISWRAPSIKHKDVAALDLLALILGQGDSSRLVTRLRMQEPLCNSIGCFAYTMQDDGLFAISYSIEKENLEKVLKNIKDILIHALSTSPTNEEMQKAIVNLASNEIYSLETVDSIGRKAGSYEFYLGDPLYYKKYLKEIYLLKPDQILKVVKKYIKISSMSVTYLTNDEVDASKKIIKKFVKELQAEIKNLKEEKHRSVFKEFKASKIKLDFKQIKSEPKTDKITLSNGMKIYLREQKDTPLVSVKTAFLGGTRIEPFGKEGLVDLLSNTWMGQTKSLSEEKINLIIDENAASMSPFAGRNSVGIGMDFLSGREDSMINLYSEIITAPRFNSMIIEREKSVAINYIKARNDNPTQVCSFHFNKAMFEGHPYSKDTHGSNESISGIGKEHIESYYSQAIHTENMHICVVGDINKDQWLKKIEAFGKYLPSKNKINLQFELKKIEKEVRINNDLKKEQAHVMLGYRGINITSPDRHVLDILNAILSGQGGRLFIELRDKKSLAYSVSPITMLGIDTGYFGGYIGCSPEKVEKAIEMLKLEFMKLANENILSNELERAQKYLIGTHDIELQRKSSVCNAILFDEIYGLNSDEGLHVSEKYYSISSEQVRTLAQKIFQQPAIISIV